ncbi:TonB-dependent receptor plug domain-containing protein [Phenylobacterium sp.]|uniref:TonB-dependent receptor plug domain-containing protein n=1 Tax=Phenylobacterium sp. TaxID=1871053 RepID=UPI00356281F4
MLQHHYVSRLMAGAAVAVLAVAAASPSFAQSSASQAPTQQSAPPADVSEVVVTGSLIRGVAPVGTTVVGVNEQQIEQMGVVSSNQILANIPAITSQFNSQPVNQTNIGISIVRPNIRNIGASGGNTTLVLIDGHNVVGAGILQTTPDSGVLPPGVLRRVEVVPDGGSSLYGADAVGGIVNFITKKKADGFEIAGHYGVADPGYQSSDLNLTGGTSWEGGSAYISFASRENSDLKAFKRDFPRQNLTSLGGSDFRVTTCAAPNVTANGVNFAAPGFTAGSVNLCDQTAASDMIPKETQNSFFGSVSQQITDRVELSVTGYWSDRITKTAGAPLSASAVTVPSTNPFFRPLNGATSESVSFDFSPITGPNANSRGELKEYGVTPVLTIKLGGDWQAKAMFNYGHSETSIHMPEVNPTALALAAVGTTAATALNPFNLSQTNSAILSAITNFENFATNTQSLSDFRVIADGSLMSLPGGDLRLAVGAEYQRQTSDAFDTDDAVGNLSAGRTKNANRNVKAVFGELLIPLVGPANAMPLMQAFSIDASARYDDYSDFGHTTNPKVGFTWDVAGGVSLRGNYGTAFNAPSLADTTGAVDTRVQVIAVSPFRAPTSPFTDLFRPTIVLAGGNPNLKPQKADTWSFGGEWKPTFFEGFQAGLSYWNIKLKDAIVVAPPGFPTSVFTVPAFQQFAIVNPTLAQAQAATAGMFVTGAPSVAALYTPFSTPYVLLDLRRKNVGNLNVSGLDFHVDYTRPTSFGAVFADLSGTYALERKSQAPGSGETDLLSSNVSRLQLSASAGANYGHFTGTATLNYSAGYDLTGAAPQTHVDSFHPVNLALVYNFDGRSWAKDLTVSLNVDNAFDEKAQFINVAPSAFGASSNGFTLGRFVNLGVRKHF